MTSIQHTFLRSLAGVPHLDMLTAMKGAFGTIIMRYGEPASMCKDDIDYVFIYDDFTVSMFWDDIADKFEIRKLSALT